MAYIIKEKIVKNNKIIGAVICDLSLNKIFNIKKEDFNKYKFLNAKITSDFKIISDKVIPVINSDKLKSNMKSITLYHGSPNKIIKPVYGKGEDKHDYGKGFYLTENKELAKEWSVYSSNTFGYVHTYSLNLEGLKIFNFNNENSLVWLAELMSHRDADNSARYKRLSVQFIEKYKKDVSSYDIIYGWRADSSYFSIAKRFIRDEVDYDLIDELFHLGGLENQVCLKSKKAFNNLKEIKEPEVVDLSYKEKYNIRDLNARKKMNDIINSDRNTMTKGFSYILKEI